MKDTYYVIFNKKGVDRFAKSQQFSLKAGEYAVEVGLEVPDSVFAPVRIPKMVISVPAEAVRREITAGNEPGSQL